MPVPLIPSQDGQAALVLVPLSADKVTTVDAEGKNPLGDVIDGIRTAAEASAAGAEVHIAGPAGLIADLSAAFAGIDGLLLLVTLSAVLVILILVYRAIALPFVVLFTSISALALAGGVVYLLAKNDVIPLNGQSQGILFILVVGAATDYGLLLVSRYREELTRVESKWTAMVRAWRACLEPIAASAGTVIIGLLCLLLSDLNSNRVARPGRRDRHRVRVRRGDDAAAGPADGRPLAVLAADPARRRARGWFARDHPPDQAGHLGEDLGRRRPSAAADLGDHRRRAGHRLPLRAHPEGLRYRADRRLPDRRRLDRRPAGTDRPLPGRFRATRW